MTLVTFASIKGSPGATTLACLVGATWPSERRVILAECDSDGGDLASRFSLSTKTGWQSLALAVRRGDATRSIVDHLQTLPGGLEVLVGLQGDNPDSGGRGAGQEPACTLRELAESENSDIIVDLGRLHLASPDTQMWLGRSDAVCLVLRSDAASIGHARDRARAVKELCGGSLLVVVVGNGPYSLPEIERFIGVTDTVEIADDPGAASVLTEGRGSKRRLARSTLVKSARRLADSLTVSEPETPTWGGADAKSLGDVPRCGSLLDAEGGESPRANGSKTLNRSLSLQDQQ